MVYTMKLIKNALHNYVTYLNETWQLDAPEFYF